MSGGGKGKKVVVGYKYLMGAHICFCHGPIDKIKRLIVGERDAYTSALVNPTHSSFAVNAPLLFGGDSREGGVAGDVDILWGDSTQPQNAYLAAKQSAIAPAYRGLFSLVFKSFMWSSGNPYFKPPWLELVRIHKGWRDDTVWNPTRATITLNETINGVSVAFDDMNPAHIIYQCLTDIEWGMGYNYPDIDTTSFTACAQTLYDEGFGLSLMWENQTDIQSFIKEIIDTIDGSLRLDTATGKFVLSLHRDGYDVNSLVNLNKSNIMSFRSFQRAGFGEFANEVVVMYTDREGNEQPVAVQDIASIQSQGAVVSRTVSYGAIRNPNLAARVALRDLRVSSTPLAKISITTNRVLHNKDVGDVVTLTWPDLGITLLPMRIVKIDKGSLIDGKIECDLTEDIFSLPALAYTASIGSSWSDPVTSPIPVEAARAFEVPYWEIVRNMTRADIDYLTPDYAFCAVAAARGLASSPFSFDLHSSPDNSAYEKVTTGHFCPTGLLSANITPTATSFTLTNFYDLSQVKLDSENGYAMIDGELVAVVSVNTSTGLVSVRRGVLDTVPATHLAGARVYFIVDSIAYDPTERTTGELTYYKPLPTTGLGTLNASLATAIPITFENRATRPYPPGQFKLNSTYYPASVSPGSLLVTWAARDRLQQTVSLVDYSQAGIGPEAGVTYNVRIYDAVSNALLHNYTGISGTSQTVPLRSTMSLLHMDGTSGSTTFTDETGHTWTVSGNAQISTAQSVFGGASAYFDGTGDYVTSVASGDFVLGTVDLTLECWIYAANTTAGYRGIASDLLYSAAGGWALYQNGTALELWRGGLQIINATGALTAATWLHVAWTRQGNTHRLFVAGALVGSGTDSVNFTNNQVMIGKSNAGDYYFNGYIDEFRLKKGEALYTANFTPPAAPFSLTGDTGPSSIRVELESERAGLTSLQKHAWTVDVV